MTLCYVIAERGEEFKRYVAIDTDDLLYQIFADVAFGMATRFEGEHRVEGEDFRRRLFAKQEALLETLNKAWKKQRQLEHALILRSFPFDDDAGRRAAYSEQ